MHSQEDGFYMDLLKAKVQTANKRILGQITGIFRVLDC